MIVFLLFSASSGQAQAEAGQLVVAKKKYQSSHINSFDLRFCEAQSCYRVSVALAFVSNDREMVAASDAALEIHSSDGVMQKKTCSSFKYNFRTNRFACD